MAENMKQKYTKQGYQDLVDELKYLKLTRREEIKEQIATARGFGDLSENAEYDEAKNEQGKVYSRIAELENLIAHAVVITDGSYAKDEVNPRCRFEVEDEDLTARCFCHELAHLDGQLFVEVADRMLSDKELEDYIRQMEEEMDEDEE